MIYTDQSPTITRIDKCEITQINLDRVHAEHAAAYQLYRKYVTDANLKALRKARARVREVETQARAVIK